MKHVKSANPGQSEQKAVNKVKALELRKRGYRYEQIAEVLGVSKKTAWNYVQEEVKKAAAKSAETAQEYWLLELLRLEMARNAIYDDVVQGKRIGEWIALHNATARLVGIQPPQKTILEHQGKDGGPIQLSADMDLRTMSDAQLNKLIAQAGGLLDTLQEHLSDGTIADHDPPES